MPQAATQRNRQPVAKPKPAKQPLPNLAPAETEDHVYGLVSVLYHALQGAQACEQYIEDAEGANDEELVRFFQDTRDQQKACAAKAKQLLVARAGDEDEDEDGEGDEKAG